MRSLEGSIVGDSLDTIFKAYDVRGVYPGEIRDALRSRRLEFDGWNR